MAGVPRSNDYESRIQRLERKVGILERQSTLTSASIGEGGLTVRDNGSIRGIGTGKLDWNGPAHFGGNTDIGGQLDVTGNTHISGDLLIDGDTTLGGNLTFAPGAVPPEALLRRVEAQTFSGSNSGSANQRDLNVTVTVPSWAQTTACAAWGTAYAQAPDGTRITALVTISGTAGVSTSGAAYAGANTIPANAARTFSPAGGSTFIVNLHTGAAPVSATPQWELTLVILCVFTKSS